MKKGKDKIKTIETDDRVHSIDRIVTCTQSSNRTSKTNGMVYQKNVSVFDVFNFSFVYL